MYTNDVIVYLYTHIYNIYDSLILIFRPHYNYEKKIFIFVPKNNFEHIPWET